MKKKYIGLADVNYAIRSLEFDIDSLINEVKLLKRKKVMLKSLSIYLEHDGLVPYCHANVLSDDLALEKFCLPLVLKYDYESFVENFRGDKWKRKWNFLMA